MNIEEKIKQYRKNGFPMVAVSDLGDGTFKNPILHTDYSDPDVIKVDDDYYMTASSFNNVPGLPILHSTDLVNWKIINYAIKELPFDDYKNPKYGRPVWAPSIRFNNGYFYIYIGFPDEGIFMTRSKNPYEDWEPLVCLLKGKGFIDTCPLWDDDGQAYLINAFAKSRIGFKSVLAIHKMNYEGTELLEDFRIVYDGNENNPTIEGPKLYKRNNFYYISAPAGGVPTGWQLILRSKSIYGPFEEKIVLAKGDTDINGPHQGAIVDINENESWFFHFQDKDAYGRIVHLQPMFWQDDWPVIGTMNEKTKIGEPVSICKKPTSTSISQPFTQIVSDDFSNNNLEPHWQWNANPNNNWYSLSQRDSHLRLFAVKEPFYDSNLIYDYANILTFKFPALEFATAAKIDLSNIKNGERGGLIVLGEEYNYISVTKSSDNKSYLNIIEGSKTTNGHVETTVYTQLITENIIYLKVIVINNAVCQFSTSFDGLNFTQIGDKFNAHVNKWVGAKIGLFCANVTNSVDVINEKGFIDIDWVLTTELE